MRILQINSVLAGGGTDDQCVKLASGLQKLGHQVSLAGPEGREYSKVAQALGLPLCNTGKRTTGFQLAFSLARIIRQEQIELVHAHHGRDYWPAVFAARLSGIQPKVVLTRHLAKSPSSWFSRLFLLNQCDAMIAVSGFVAKVMSEGVYEPASPDKERQSRPRIHGDYFRIRVINGGIDTNRFKPSDATALRSEWGLSPEHHAFAVAGVYGLPRGKGQREFLEAAARIHKECPNARFLIIGRGNMADLLRSDIQRLGLQDKAQLTPYCHDMPAAMNALDCLVHPAVGTEAFGAVLCEAFACGKPVIASALDGIPEAFAKAKYGCLVTPGSVDELAKAMAEWSQKPGPSLAEREAMHTRIAEDVSLTRYATNVSNLYRELMDDE